MSLNSEAQSAVDHLTNILASKLSHEELREFTEFFDVATEEMIDVLLEQLY